MDWKKTVIALAILGLVTAGVSLNIAPTSTAISVANAETQLCEYHRIAKDVCTRCNPNLIPAFKAKGDWCAEHNLPESQCDICNPSLRNTQQAPVDTAPNETPQESAASAKDNHPTKLSAVDWCSEHRVPESQCTKCNPKLIESFKASGDWCGGHDVPESHCYLCNSGLKFEQEARYNQTQVKTAAIDWCSEHRVPESQCTKCHPELIESFKAKNDWCGGHNIPESHCYLCNPGLKFEQETEFKKQQPNQKQSHVPNTSLYRANSGQCATDNAVIQFASIQTASRSGLSIVTVEELPVAETLRVPGEIEFDATQSASVTCPISGVLTRWVVNPGEQVQRGQILAYVESIDAAEKIADYVHASALHNLARKTYDRKRELARNGSANAREVDEAEASYLQTKADLNRSKSILKLLGYTDDNIAELIDDAVMTNLIPLRARQNGRLVEQSVKLGAILDAGVPIGMISETAQLWVEAQVPEKSIDRVKVGQLATVSQDESGWTTGTGHVIWIADGVDENTRMGKVRIAIEPSGENLRSHQFVRVQIETIAIANSMMVPSDAVQWEGCCNVVFVQETPDRIRPRKINVEFVDGDFYAVSGVRAGEKIVSKGSYMLKTELMKGSIGAGCCGEGA